MRTFSLQSGSNGNTIYVEAAGIRLLFDAGISGRQAERRLADKGGDIRRVDGLIISHDHSDHVRCAGIYQRKYELPVYLTRRTLKATSCNLSPLNEVHYFRAGRTLDFGRVQVHTLSTPHDAADGVVFVIEAEGKRLGIFTDLGHVFPGLADCLETLDGLYLESNYDPQMLEEGPYPAFLKARIKGKRGHLSNLESAELVEGLPRHSLRWLALAHLSENNNTPEVALETHQATYGSRFRLHVATRYEPSRTFRL